MRADLLCYLRNTYLDVLHIWQFHARAPWVMNWVSTVHWRRPYSFKIEWPLSRNLANRVGNKIPTSPSKRARGNISQSCQSRLAIVCDGTSWGNAGGASLHFGLEILKWFSIKGFGPRHWLITYIEILVATCLRWDCSLLFPSSGNGTSGNFKPYH